MRQGDSKWREKVILKRKLASGRKTVYTLVDCWKTYTGPCREHKSFAKEGSKEDEKKGFYRSTAQVCI